MYIAHLHGGQTMFSHTRLGLAGIGVLILVAAASAQTALGTLRGVVLDQQGGALPGVTITARQFETNATSTAVTGVEGQYFLPNLRPGHYEITAELSSFAAEETGARFTRRSGIDHQPHHEPGGRGHDRSRSSGRASRSARKARWRPSSRTNRSTISRRSAAISASSRRCRPARRNRTRPAPARAPACRSRVSGRSSTASPSTARPTRCSSTDVRRTISRRTGFRNSRSSRIRSAQNMGRPRAAC